MDLDAPSEAASSPLSLASMSPTPPPEFRPYPSPSSSQLSSAEASPLPEVDSTTVSADEDGAPPRKRRKTEPKPRTTEYLDLRAGDVDPAQKAQLDRLLKVLHKKRKIVVIAGAGISVSAGIPDFRSSNGLFQTLRGKHNLKSSGKDLFDASVYKDSTSTASFHAMVRELSEKTREASPTPFHHLLATLAHDGRLLRLYSQNVDCIDTKLPPLATTVPLAKPWPKTIQVHGGLDKMVCSKCQTVSDLRPDLFTEPLPPSCSDCVATDSVRTEHAGKRSHGIGKLRPRMVLYNEHNPDAEAIGSVTRADLRSRPDAVIVAGTTLKVPGVRRIAREMCNVVRDRRDGVAVWINNDPEPTGKDLENCWDLVVRGPCDEVAKHAAMRKWTDDKEDFEKADEVTEDHVKKVKDERGLKEIAINAPSKSRIKSESDMILTPLESPTLRPQQVTTSTEDGEAITKKGKKIRTILSRGKASQSVANRKAKPKSKKPAQAKKAESIKINTVFSASKPMKPGARGEKAKNKKDDADSLLSKTRPSTPQTPMAQIPPQDVRNNSSPLSSPPSELEQPSPTYKTQEDDTIHPVGCIPSGFANLLATSPT